MTWKQARLIAVQHVRRLKIPRRLDGIPVKITTYDDEDTLRFIKPEEPELTLASQRLISQAFARELRKRGAHIEYVPVNVAKYLDWLADHDLKNNAGNRAQYIAWLTAPDPATPI